MHKKIYLMRHAEALNKEQDAERPLSELGRGNAKKMAAWMHAVGVPITTILHSPILRAKETAEIVSGVYNLKPTVFEALSTEASLVSLAQSVGDLSSGALLIGHLPNLDLLSNLLVTYDEQCTTLSFQPAAVAAFDLTENRCLIDWTLYPALLP